MLHTKMTDQKTQAKNHKLTICCVDKSDDHDFE